MILPNFKGHPLYLLRRAQKWAIVRLESGVAAVEFAILAPVFLSLLMVTFEFGFAFYARAILQGAVEEAARSASLENTQWSAISQRVSSQIKTVIPTANAQTDISFQFDPVYYASYADIEVPEDFEDNNNNDQWDPEECFVDRNSNRNYDTDVGLDGRGGAQDVVTIDATVSYVRPFPIWGLFGLDQRQTIRVSTYLRNQPFSAQAAQQSLQICPAA